jgi:hypothetical protein
MGQPCKSFVDLYSLFAKDIRENPKKYEKITRYVRGQLPENSAPALAKQVLSLINVDRPLDLESHLIQPIQRGPRYSMLINEVLKNKDTLDDTNTEELNNIKELVLDFLLSVNASIAKPTQVASTQSTVKGYEFGDLTYAFVNWVSSHFPERSPEKKGYKLGDGSRWLKAAAWSFFNSATQTQDPVQQTEEINKDEEADDEENIKSFRII